MAKAVPSNPRGGEAGFTLVEALIAIIVLVFGLGVTNLFVAKTTTPWPNQSSAATTAASETLERLRALSFTDLVTQAGATWPAPGAPSRSATRTNGATRSQASARSTRSGRSCRCWVTSICT